MSRSAGFSFKNTFAALRYRNYNIWFRGQITSLLGNWMQQTAQAFLIYELTDSPAYLGYVGFAAGIPVWFFTLYAGTIADRVDKRKLMLVTQSCMMLLAMVLSLLVFTGLVQAWHILVLAFLLGVVNSFDTPARLSIVGEMVPREDMTNAVAMNAMMFNTGSAIGPAIAGLVYAKFGAGWCFAINALSFVGVLTALYHIRLPVRERAKTKGKPLAEMAIGLRYIQQHKLIITLMLVASATSVFGLSFTTLFPAWAVDVLHGDSRTNGLLQSARGIGAFCSALLIASLGRFQYRGKVLTLGSFLFPITVLLFALVDWIPLSLFLLCLTGVSGLMVMNLANGIVQTIVPDELRGRVMSIYSLNFFGLTPFGALLIGNSADAWGPVVAVLINASILLCISSALWVFAPWLRKFE
jgi:MFS family permease